jgi:hypothetical protein
MMKNGDEYAKTTLLKFSSIPKNLYWHEYIPCLELFCQPFQNNNKKERAL